MMFEPDYNSDHPPSLVAAGSLKGKAIAVEVASIQPCEGRPIFIARIADGAASRLLLRGGRPRTVAVKATFDGQARIPRNPRREALLLAKLQHPNVLSLLNAYLSEPTSASPTPRVTLFTPYYPYTLPTLLASQSFTLERSPATFPTLAISIAYQLVAAVAYLHEQGIAHRDINPNNVALSTEGRVVLIDLGIAIEEGDEPPGAMYFEVGTGAHRAPELVFGSRAYDAQAVDLWALGTTLASLFRPLVYPQPPTPDSEDAFEQYYHQCATPPPEPVLQRDPLFEGGASDFLLAASIFRKLGTPTLDTWPEAAGLPNFARFTFASFPPTPLATHLPNLSAADSALLDVLEGLLQISARKRLPAAEALRHLERNISEGCEPTLLLPEDLDEQERQMLAPSRAPGGGGSGPSLGEILQLMFNASEGPGAVD